MLLVFVVFGKLVLAAFLLDWWLFADCGACFWLLIYGRCFYCCLWLGFDSYLRGYLVFVFCWPVVLVVGLRLFGWLR